MALILRVPTYFALIHHTDIIYSKIELGIEYGVECDHHAVGSGNAPAAEGQKDIQDRSLIQIITG